MSKINIFMVVSLLPSLAAIDSVYAMEDTQTDAPQQAAAQPWRQPQAPRNAGPKTRPRNLQAPVIKPWYENEHQLKDDVSWKIENINGGDNYHRAAFGWLPETNIMRDIFRNNSESIRRFEGFETEFSGYRWRILETLTYKQPYGLPIEHLLNAPIEYMLYENSGINYDAHPELIRDNVRYLKHLDRHLKGITVVFNGPFIREFYCTRI